MAFVYVLRSGDEPLFKIGRTRGGLEARIRQLATGNPHRLTLFDHIEKNLETVRSWGVAVSKSGNLRASDSIAIQREMEAVIKNLREAVSMARINKNEFLEQVAAVFEERGQRDTAAAVRDLKLEVSIKGAQHETATA